MFVNTYKLNRERTVYQRMKWASGQSDKIFEARKDVPGDLESAIDMLERNDNPDAGKERNIFYHQFRFEKGLKTEGFKELCSFIMSYLQCAESYIASGYEFEGYFFLDIYIHESFLKGTGYLNMENEILEKAASIMGRKTEVLYSFGSYCSHKHEDRNLEYYCSRYSYISLERLAEINSWRTAAATTA